MYRSSHPTLLGLWPEYFLNLALFHLKIPKSTTQGPRLSFSSSIARGRPEILTQFPVRMSGKRSRKNVLDGEICVSKNTLQLRAVQVGDRPWTVAAQNVVYFLNDFAIFFFGQFQQGIIFFPAILVEKKCHGSGKGKRGFPFFFLHSNEKKADEDKKKLGSR